MKATSTVLIKFILFLFFIQAGYSASAQKSVQQMIIGGGGGDDGGGGGGGGSFPETLVIYSDHGWNLMPGTTAKYYVTSGTVSVWDVTGATSSQVSGNQVTVTWGSSPTGKVIATGFANGSIAEGQKTISIIQPPSRPPSPSQDESCDSKFRHYVTHGTPPNHVLWYWQQENDTRSKNLGHASRMRVNPGETYYLQAYDTDTDLWSEERSIYGVLVEKYYPNMDVLEGDDACEGGLGHLTLTNETSYIESCEWYDASTNTSTGKRGVDVDLPPGSYYAIFKIKDPWICSNLKSKTVTITENSFPVVDAGQIQGGGDYCSLDDFMNSGRYISSIREASITSGNGIINGYQWYASRNGGAYDSIIGQTDKDLYIPAGHLPVGASEQLSFKRKVSYTGKCSNVETHKFSNGVDFNVYDRPNLSMVEVDVDDGCGESIITMPTPNGNYTFYWQTSASSFDDTDDRPEIILTPSSPRKEYYLAAKHNITGCWNDASNSKYVVANPLIIPQATISAYPETVCYNKTAILTAETNTSNYVYWTDDSGNDLGSENPLTTTRLKSGETFHLKTVSGDGCENTSSVFIDVYQPYYFEPDAPIVKKINNSEYELSLINLKADFAYYWLDQGAGIRAQDRLVDQPGIYVLKALNSDGCDAGSASVEVFDLQPHLDKTITNPNYVRTFTYLKENVTDVNDIAQVAENTQYIDGLGRTIQVVDKQATPQRTDLVMPQEYDAAGNNSRAYLPYKSSANDGKVKTQPYQDQHDFYNAGSSATVVGSYYPFAFTEIERAPTQRINAQHAPGESWAGEAGTISNKGIHNKRWSNAAGEVLLWRVVNDNPVYKDDKGALTYYAENMLFKIVTSDEQKHKVIEFTDMEGKTILKKVQAHENGQTEVWADTYYIYDDFGNLRFVLPPMASKAISEGSALNDDLLIQWAFQYKYDGRNRMIEKKVPGADWVYMIYDKRDRLVLTQDGNQREEDSWLFTKYDVLNRPIATGKYYSTLDRPEMQQEVSEFYDPEINWVSLNHLTLEGDIITKTSSGSGWGSAGGASSELIADGEDGFIGFEATETNTYRLFGLSDVSPDDHRNSVDYAIYLYGNGTVVVNENGVTKGSTLTYETGDIFTVRRKGSTIYYEKNSKVFYSSTIPSSGSLIADLAFLTSDASLKLWQPVYYEIDGDSRFDYTSYSFPYSAEQNDYLTLTYYDDYNFHHAGLADYAFEPNSWNNTYFNRVKGQVTGTMTKVLGSEKWLRSINYYDDKYRVIQSVMENNEGGIDRTSNQYDFVGKVLKTKTSHDVSTPIIWVNQKNIKEEAGVYTSTTMGWNAGMSSINVLKENEDGWVEFIVNEIETNRFLGFNDHDDLTGHADMEFSLYLYGKSLRAYSDGSLQQVIGLIEKGDVIRLTREAGIIKVYLNGQEVYAYGETSTESLHIDISMYNYASIGNIKTSLSLPEANEASYPVYWTNLQYMQVRGDSLIKTVSGWNGNASSINKLKAYQDGWLEFSVVDPGKALMVGMSDYDYDAGYGSLDYAIYINSDSTVQARENGAYKQTFQTCATGDVFRIERIGETVYYKKNEQIFYTAETLSNKALIADVSFNTGSVSGLKASFNINRSEINNLEVNRSFDYDHAGRLINTWHTIPNKPTFIDEVGVISDGNSLIKTGNNGYNAGAATLDYIPEGMDGAISIEVIGDNRIMFGLSETNTDAGYSSIDYGFLTYPNTGGIIIIEKGNSKGLQGYYKDGDVLKISRELGTINYYINDDKVYTSSISSSSSLIGDFTLYNNGDTISNIMFQRPVLLAHNEYNELGELIDKKLYSEDEGNTFKQSVDYRYNIRGWLTRINDSQLSDGEEDLFGMELGYNEDIGLSSAVPQFNGNISAVKWSGSVIPGKQNAYAYTYDAMNRISSADYKEGTNNVFASGLGHYNLEEIDYDLNGNILGLNRFANHSGKEKIDALVYNYGAGTSEHSNQLLQVDDNSTSAFKDEGFKDVSGTDYEYDANGNMTKDLNKGIVKISYNHLNLPEIVEKDDGQRIRYSYDAAGIKLSQHVEIGEVLYQSDFTSGNDDWSLTRLDQNAVDGIGGKNAVLKLSAKNNSNAHFIQQFLEIVNTTVRLKFDIYIPSSNTHVDGIKVTLGASSENLSPQLDRWETIDITRRSPNALVRIYETKAGNHSFTGAGGDDDIIYLKNVSITRYKGKTTDYDGEFIYETNEEGIKSLALIQHEEGRLVPNEINGGWEYQYHLKDHLGNTRLTFTTKPKTISFTANYEGDANNPDDADLFENVEISAVKDFNHTTGSASYDKSQILYSSPNRQIGSAIAIPVGTGDKITATAYAKYMEAAENTSVTAATLSSLLVSAFTGSPSVGSFEGGTSTINDNFADGSLIGGTGFPYEDADAPKAFLNVMFLPDGEAIDLVKDATFAYDQISDGATEAGIDGTSDDLFDELKIENFVAPANGYILVYVSNEGSLTDVHFDDMLVTVNESPVIQKDDYYPFGLTFNSYQRVTAKENKYLFGGKEIQDDLGLGWLDFHARQYDPAIGRMLSIDQLSEISFNWTPFRFGFNNPLRYSDPSGMSEVDENGNITYTNPDEISNVMAGLKKMYGNVKNVSNNNQEEPEPIDQILKEQGVGMTRDQILSPVWKDVRDGLWGFVETIMSPSGKGKSISALEDLLKFLGKTGDIVKASNGLDVLVDRHILQEYSSARLSDLKYYSQILVDIKGKYSSHLSDLREAKNNLPEGPNSAKARVYYGKQIYKISDKLYTVTTEIRTVKELIKIKLDEYKVQKAGVGSN